MRSHFRTPSTTTVNSIQHSAGISPALNSTTGPHGWDSPSRLSALSRTSSSIGQQQYKGDLPDRSEFTEDGQLENRSGHLDTHQAGEVTGFVFHTMKDCTKLLFREDDRFPDTDTASVTPKSGFMRRLSVATDTEDADQSTPRHWGLPTVMAVNGLIAVGTESGWVAVMDFKQELKRVCGTESASERTANRVLKTRNLIRFSSSQILRCRDCNRYKSRRNVRRRGSSIGKRVALRARFQERQTDQDCAGSTSSGSVIRKEGRTSHRNGNHSPRIRWTASHCNCYRRRIRSRVLVESGKGRRCREQ